MRGPTFASTRDAVKREPDRPSEGAATVGTLGSRPLKIDFHSPYDGVVPDGDAPGKPD